MRATRWLPFEWVVAIRFLQEGKIQTGFIAVGIAIGVAVIVFMSALLAGLSSSAWPMSAAGTTQAIRAPHWASSGLATSVLR